MDYFFDTEFLWQGRDKPLEILSLGMVNENNETLYLIRDLNDPVWETVKNLDDPWLMNNVYANLFNSVVSGKVNLEAPVTDFADYIRMFINYTKPTFYGYYADYDWVLFTGLFGGMLDVPQSYPQYCRDIKQMSDERKLPRFPKQTQLPEHNALNDALWTKAGYDWMMALDRRSSGSVSMHNVGRLDL